MKKGQEYVGYVKKVKFPNKGIVTVSGDEGEENCTVKNVICGQKVRFRITRKRNGTCEGQLLEIIERSPVETESACPHFDVCGGCSYQTLPYEEQLRLKEQQVHELLEPVIAAGYENYRKESGTAEDKVDIKSLFEPIVPSPIQ
nr:23S rRNA (uracil-5-)-methyltransferase RumA [Lachnospiraceae bacterium]